MEKKDWKKSWNLLVAYLREQRKTLSSMILFTVFFFVLAFLSHLPLQPLLYAALLSWVVGLFSLLSAFPRFLQTHLSLTLLEHARNTEQSVLIQAEDLPEPSGILEKDYQSLLLALNRNHQHLSEEQEQQTAQAQQYYTLWAHQIKTPISAMRLLIQEGRSTFPQEALGQELFKVEQYVDMALQYLRLGHGTHDLLLQQYDLKDMVRQALKRTSTLFICKKISLNLGEINSKVITDEKWVVFVLEQLLTNAVKYTPKGSVSIHTLPGGPDTLVIRDTGIGIRPEDLPRIFDWGYTGRNGRDEKRSTGIGLFLCRQAFDILGHTITIRSTPGEGTSVYLNFSRETLDIE